MNDLIYNQRSIPKEQWRYGLRSSADAGCGWIATYNALRLMGYRTDIEKLIRYYEFAKPASKERFMRKSGILMHITSLPTPFRQRAVYHSDAGQSSRAALTRFLLYCPTVRLRRRAEKRHCAETEKLQKECPQ